MTTLWDEALAACNRATMIAEAIDDGAHEAAFDAATDVQTETIELLLSTPAPSLSAVAEKLRIMQSTGNQHLLAPVLRDVERLAGPPEPALADPIAIIPPDEDPALVRAFDDYRAASGELRVSVDDLSDEAAAPFYARMDPADVVMKDTPARTLTGVLMKIKRAFAGWDESAWSDDAVLNERPAEFEHGVLHAGLYVEMMWRGIEDLERIAQRGGSNG